MKKILILLLFFLLVSCTKQETLDYTLQVEGTIENYLFILNDESCVIIKYDNRVIDKDKLLSILNLQVNKVILLEEDVVTNIIDIVSKYRSDEESLTQVFIENKKSLEPKIENLLYQAKGLDIKEFTDKLNKQTVYYFDDIDEIKDSANHLALWLDQVRKLSTRKDL